MKIKFFFGGGGGQVGGGGGGGRGEGGHRVGGGQGGCEQRSKIFVKIKTSSPKGNDRSPDKQVFLNSSQGK